MKVGADRKKIVLLSGLGLVLAYFLYTNLISSPTEAPRTDPRPGGGRIAAAKGTEAADISRPAPLKSRNARPDGNEFRPSVKHKDFIDPTRADPILHLDLMAKVQAVQLEGGERNLFQFGTAPPPKPVTPDPKIIPGKTSPEGPQAAKNGAKAGDPPTPKPPAAPISLKFYGFTSQGRQATKRAFFLDGDDIIVAVEGDVVSKRYKVVRIGINSVVMEDVQTKSEQTLPLVAEAPS